MIATVAPLASHGSHPNSRWLSLGAPAPPTGAAAQPGKEASMFSRSVRSLPLAGLVVLAGCARVPQAEVDVAGTAFDAARQGKAELYAPAEYEIAASAFNALNTELDAQEGKNPFARNYDSASTLATVVKSAADTALARATAARELARLDAAALLEDVRADFTRLQAAVAQAGARRGGPDPAVLRAEAETIRQTLTAADSALATGRYLEAMDSGVQARQQMQQLTSRLAAPGRPRRG